MDVTRSAESADWDMGNLGRRTSSGEAGVTGRREARAPSPPPGWGLWGWRRAGSAELRPPQLFPAGRGSLISHPFLLHWAVGKINSEIVPVLSTVKSLALPQAHSHPARDTVITMPTSQPTEAQSPQGQGLDPGSLWSQLCLSPPHHGLGPLPSLSSQSQRPYGPGALRAGGPQLLPVRPWTGCNQDPPKPPGP